MKRMLVVTGAIAATLFAVPSATAAGVNLAWDNCASEGGTANLSSACLTNSGTSILTGSFVLNADMAGVTGIEIVLDVIVGDGTSPIPPWWQAEIGGCRPGSIVMTPTVNPANTVCLNWANGVAAGGLAAYTGGFTGNPANTPAIRRIVGGFAVALPDRVSLIATREYFAFNVVINDAGTVGTPSCAGCTVPACIVLNSIYVDTSNISVRQSLTNGTSAGSNFATWQGVGPSCQLVPTKRATWGQVKSLYH